MIGKIWGHKAEVMGMSVSINDTAVTLGRVQDSGKPVFLVAKSEDGRRVSMHTVASEAARADCRDLAVEVDSTAGVVSLLLRDGVLLRDGTQSTIGKEGYRMLLVDVTPKKAMTTMMSMVVRK